MATIVKDIVTWLKQWYYTESEVDTLLGGKVSKEQGSENASKLVMTDTGGEIKVFAKSSLDVGDLSDSGGVIPTDVGDLTDTGGIIPTNVNQLVGSTANRFVVTDANKNIALQEKIGNITKDGKIGSNANYVVTTTTNGLLTASSYIDDRQVYVTNSQGVAQGTLYGALENKANSSHTQASSTITDSNTYSHLNNASATQESINSAIDTAIGNLSSINALNIVSTLPTASASTMGKLYIISENSKVNVYYTEQTGTGSSASYSWHKMDTDILDEFSIAWGDVTGKPTWESTTSNIKMNGTASVGSSGKFVNSDHIHPSDTSKADKTSALSTTITLCDIGDTNAGCIIFNTIS